MSTAVSRRRGTTAEHATFTGIESEITVDTDVYTLVVHDGVTAGGYRLRRDYVDTTNVLLGRSSGGAGVIENITIGSGLVLTGGVLHATGGGSSAANDASYLALGTHATLTNERVFTPGNGLQATDNGANNTYALSVKTSDFLGSYALTGQFIRTGNILPGTGVTIFNSGQYTYVNVTPGITDHGALGGLSDDDHSQYIYTSPADSLRNIITPTADETPLILRGAVGQAKDLFQIQNDSAGIRLYVDSNFKLWAAGGLDAGDDKVTSVGNPTAAQDAVTLNYLTGNYKSYTGSTATGTLLVANGTTFTGLPIGSNDQVLAVTGNTAAWKTPDYSWSYWYGFERRPIAAAVTGGAFTLGATDASVANATDEDGITMGRTASDGNITYLAFQFACPTELDTAQAMDATVYCRIAGAGSNQIEFKCRARAVNRDEGMLAGGTYRESSGTQSLTSYASDDLATVAISNVFTAGELDSQNSQLIKGSIIRDATAANGSDTYANTVIILGVRFSGYRKKWV